MLGGFPGADSLSFRINTDQSPDSLDVYWIRQSGWGVGPSFAETLQVTGDSNSGEHRWIVSAKYQLQAVGWWGMAGIYLNRVKSFYQGHSVDDTYQNIEVGFILARPGESWLLNEGNGQILLNPFHKLHEAYQKENSVDSAEPDTVWLNVDVTHKRDTVAQELGFGRAVLVREIPLANSAPRARPDRGSTGIGALEIWSGPEGLRILATSAIGREGRLEAIAADGRRWELGSPEGEGKPFRPTAPGMYLIRLIGVHTTSSRAVVWMP